MSAVLADKGHRSIGDTRGATAVTRMYVSFRPRDGRLHPGTSRPFANLKIYGEMPIGCDNLESSRVCLTDAEAFVGVRERRLKNISLLLALPL